LKNERYVFLTLQQTAVFKPSPGENNFTRAKMKGYTTILAVVMFSASTILPVPTRAAGSPFVEAGFIEIKDEIPALDFTLEDLEGRQVELRYFRGKVVLLFFWTTW
jgi:cytochrome oxidase Cu insertion factor (SCO1/SenC/PrrC family)